MVGNSTATSPVGASKRMSGPVPSTVTLNQPESEPPGPNAFNFTVPVPDAPVLKVIRQLFPYALATNDEPSGDVHEMTWPEQYHSKEYVWPLTNPVNENQAVLPDVFDPVVNPSPSGLTRTCAHRQLGRRRAPSIVVSTRNVRKETATMTDSG